MQTVQNEYTEGRILKKRQLNVKKRARLQNLSSATQAAKVAAYAA